MKPNKSPKEVQSNLFHPLLVDFINLKHPLVKLSESIDWDSFDNVLDPLYSDKGRKGKENRLMVALHYLKYSFALSDEEVVKTFIENPYYQYFCGEKYFRHDFPIDSSSLTRWRKRLKNTDIEKLLSETIQTGLRNGFIKKKDLEKVVVDTTVQEKHIRFPTDSRLYDRMREKLVEQAKKENINLRQNYNHLAKTCLHRQSGYAKAGQMKRARKMTLKLKTFLGRVVRDIHRKAYQQSEKMKDLLVIAHALLKQEKTDKNKIYSIHEKDVECIAKGKVHKAYEFGNKVSISSSLDGNWVIGAKAFHGNPYDGHILSEAIKQTEKITQVESKKIVVDMGYRGHNYQGNAVVSVVNRYRKKVNRQIKRIWKRRSAIEPIISHLKSDSLLDKNRLKGKEGDKTNVILSACGYNIRKLLNAFSFALNFPILFFENVIEMTISKYENAYSK